MNELAPDVSLTGLSLLFCADFFHLSWSIAGNHDFDFGGYPDKD
jgi:hypothetical protein